MTDAASSPLVLVGDPSAAACVGDSCEVPAQREQAVVNRRLDEDLV
jgi:hypothetical protein